MQKNDIDFGYTPALIQCKISTDFRRRRIKNSNLYAIQLKRIIFEPIQFAPTLPGIKNYIFQKVIIKTSARRIKIWVNANKVVSHT